MIFQLVTSKIATPSSEKILVNFGLIWPLGSGAKRLPSVALAAEGRGVGKNHRTVRGLPKTYQRKPRAENPDSGAPSGPQDPDPAGLWTRLFPWAADLVPGHVIVIG